MKTKYELFTIEGCQHCPPVKKMLEDDIASGEVELTHLSEDTDPDMSRLKRTDDMGINGFPTLIKYNDDGTYCEVDPFDKTAVIKCYPKK
tara:strand:- start:1673 stop:1942 length:270 start_codon:yes stop_codon:yes gene_type:complete